MAQIKMQYGSDRIQPQKTYLIKDGVELIPQSYAINGYNATSLDYTTITGIIWGYGITKTTDSGCIKLSYNRTNTTPTNFNEVVTLSTLFPTYTKVGFEIQQATFTSSSGAIRVLYNPYEEVNSGSITRNNIIVNNATMYDTNHIVLFARQVTTSDAGTFNIWIKNLWIK